MGQTRTCGCGCGVSFGAKKIDEILQSNNLIIKHEITFKNCINPITNKKLKFDFGIYNQNNAILYLIEYDGEQHFYYQINDTSWNTKERFDGTKYRDGLKNKYCLDNNIPLYRIPYYDIKNINTLDDILKDKYRIM